MRMPTLLYGARPFGKLFRMARGAEPGCAAVLLLLLVLWPSMVRRA